MEEMDQSVPDLKGKLVYIAEDDQASGAYLKEILAPTSAELILVRNGKELTDQIKEIIPDIILLDMNMPVKSGFDCLSEIRKVNKNIKIIAQTAYAMDNERIKCMEMGCNDYISKPINKDELFIVIRRVMN